MVRHSTVARVLNSAELQMILLVLGIYVIVSLYETLQICSVYGFHLQMHQS